MGRDWDLLARLKSEHWQAIRRDQGWLGSMLIAEGLRHEMKLLRPEWPSDVERREDLASHVRVAELLQRAARAG